MVASSSYAPLLDIQPNEPTYTHMTTAWPRGSRVTIDIAGAVNPVDIPLAFLESSGSNTWELVLHMLHTLVNERGRLVSSNRDGPIGFEPQAEPIAGQYSFVPVEAQRFTWARGRAGL